MPFVSSRFGVFSLLVSSVYAFATSNVDWGWSDASRDESLTSIGGFPSTAMGDSAIVSGVASNATIAYTTVSVASPQRASGFVSNAASGETHAIFASQAANKAILDLHDAAISRLHVELVENLARFANLNVEVSETKREVTQSVAELFFLSDMMMEKREEKYWDNFWLGSYHVYGTELAKRVSSAFACY